MDIREFRYYQYLAELGYVEPINCLNDIEHGPMLANIDNRDILFLWCLACDYKLFPGITLESTIKNRIKKVSKDNIND